MHCRRKDFQLTSRIEVNHASMKWRIHNFHLWTPDDEEVLSSEPFSCGPSSWMLELHPRLIDEDLSEWIGIFLKATTLQEEKRVLFKVGLKDKNDVEQYVRTGEYVCALDDEVFGFSSLVKREQLLKEKREELYHGNFLTLYCEVTVVGGIQHGKVLNSADVPMKDIPRSLDCSDMLSRNLLALYEAQKFCDFTLRTPERQFPVHKAVLAAHSSVFALMFERVKGRSSVVEVKDISTPVLKDFIHFLYTGRLDEMTTEKTMSLLYAADKYAIEELRRGCVDFCSKKMTVDNFFYFANVACTQKDLMEPVQFFFSRYFRHLVLNKQWVALAEERPELASEIKNSPFIDR